jgi:predicted DCC family thiol-disulfide oxidoreductase YuxK
MTIENTDHPALFTNPILLFDGICILCNGMVKFLLKRDKKSKFKFAALQSVSGQELLKQHNLPMDQFDSFVYIYNNRVYLKSSAVLHVLKDLGGIWKLFYAFIIIPRPIRDFGYDIVAKTRYRIFGKRDTCVIPTDDINQRFL